MKKKNKQCFIDPITMLLIGGLSSIFLMVWVLYEAKKKEELKRNTNEYKIQNCIANGKELLKAIYNNPDNISGTPTSGNSAVDIINRCHDLYK